jgi:hypothetical protein
MLTNHRLDERTELAGVCLSLLGMNYMANHRASIFPGPPGYPHPQPGGITEAPDHRCSGRRH